MLIGFLAKNFCGNSMTCVALVVGINTYTYFRDLNAPAKDAEAIALFLIVLMAII